MSKSFEEIFEENKYGFIGYDGPCKCCNPKPTEKATKAYARGLQDEQKRIIALLEDAGERNYISQSTYDYVVSIIKESNV